MSAQDSPQPVDVRQASGKWGEPGFAVTDRAEQEEIVLESLALFQREFLASGLETALFVAAGHAHQRLAGLVDHAGNVTEIAAEGLTNH